MKLAQIANLFNIPCSENIELTGVTIDSRQVQTGHLFIAIKGERFDGHDFVEEVLKKGAAAIVCERINPQISLPQLVVDNTLNALKKIATMHREYLSLQVIALTGSNGKTTVKEMIHAILPEPKYATRGNLNNHIGAPLSVLSLNTAHRYAVFELGANHPGDIAYLVPVVKPQVTLINNIAPAHIEGFGSIDGVAKAKGEIHQGLSHDGTAVINDDDAYAHFWDDGLVDKKILRFSALRPADIFARHVHITAEGCAQFELVTPRGQVLISLMVRGKHHVNNALAASACAYAVGISLDDIAKGLSQFTGVSGRTMFRTGRNRSVIIDDTYNANLGSALTAIDVLSTCAGRRILVFGDMAELGTYSEDHHQEVGIAARQRGIDHVMTVGRQSGATSKAFGGGSSHFETQSALIAALLPQLDEHTTVLVKGSRSSGMENIVQQCLFIES